MHVGLPDPNKDVERVRAVREMLGPDVALLVDAAQLIASPKASIRLARRIEEFDIGWYEEPVAGSNPQSEAKVAAAVSTLSPPVSTHITTRASLSYCSSRLPTF